jgi:uncharacterized Zn finger protein
MEKLMCPHCKAVDFPVVKKKEFENIYGKQFHLEARCKACGKFIKNLKQNKGDN